MFRCCASMLYECQKRGRWFETFKHGHESFMTQHSLILLYLCYIMLLRKKVEKDFTEPSVAW